MVFFFLVLQIFSFLSLLSFLFVKDLFVTKSFCLVLIDAKCVLAGLSLTSACLHCPCT